MTLTESMEADPESEWKLTIDQGVKRLLRSTAWSRLAPRTREYYQDAMIALQGSEIWRKRSVRHAALALAELVPGDGRNKRIRSGLLSLLKNVEPAPHFAYAIEAEGLNLVKVGRTSNLQGRIMAMGTDCPCGCSSLRPKSQRPSFAPR